MLPVQVSAAHKIVGVPFAEEVKNLFPEARPIEFAGAPHLILPHGLTETFMLRKLGYDVPSPILTTYDWANSRRPPFEVQKKTASLLTMNPRAYVLNEMGTGKTKTPLWAWDYLRDMGAIGRLLISAPLSTLAFVWAAEVFETLPHRKAVILHGTKARRLSRLTDPEAEIFIINHDGHKVLFDELMAQLDIDALVIDELAVFRNGGSDRTKAMRKLARRMKWVWGMGGSPIPTSPTDAWAQASIVTPHTVPKHFNKFRDELMTQVADFKWIAKPDAVERAFAALQPSVRFKLEDVTELPELIERTQDVALGPKQAKIYKALADQCYAAVQSQEITAANAGAVMMKLLQVSLGWVYAKDGSIVRLDNHDRMDALLNAVLGTQRKIIVFVPFKHALAGISEYLTNEGIEHAVVSGDTPERERTEIFQLFQNTEKYHALVAHPQCVAHGLTLTAADTVLWFGPVTSLEIYEQANRRIRRVGQRFKQLVLNLQGTPVEKKIYALLQKNQQVQNSLLKMFEDASINL